MSHPQSKVTAQGQISVPAAIRKKLGIGPGSVLVRKAGRCSSEEVHAALVEGASAKSQAIKVKPGIKQYMLKKHARR